MSIRLIAMAFALGALSACGTETSQVVQTSRDFFVALTQRAPDNLPDLRTRLTPEVLSALGGPILIVELLENNAEAGAQLVRSSGDVEVWSTLNAIQLTFRRGVLISTRGLSGDLMSADIEQVLPALMTGGRGAVRVHRYLDGEEQEMPRALICDYERAGREQITLVTGTYTTTRIDETCVSSTETVENQYWIDTSGTMRKSRQWIGPFAGYILSERIND